MDLKILATVGNVMIQNKKGEAVSVYHLTVQRVYMLEYCRCMRNTTTKME